ncbi:hypothetical protein NDU88_004123 [Pleurodeles waltl]|uniref:Uncharacterized protein n=1 Tax=Pleurodeles waltl TaxID=8319 RepID=A0AAV7N0L3_PLEWA|nr:hypothetical protein NDU88_004123 [Pleurodeles waltl]
MQSAIRLHCDHARGAATLFINSTHVTLGSRPYYNKPEGSTLLIGSVDFIGFSTLSFLLCHHQRHHLRQTRQEAGVGGSLIDSPAPFPGSLIGGEDPKPLQEADWKALHCREDQKFLGAARDQQQSSSGMGTARPERRRAATALLELQYGVIWQRGAPDTVMGNCLCLIRKQSYAPSI